MTADLDFTLDLGSGPIAGRIEGDGQRLTVTTDDADAVWRAASEVPELGTSALPFLADRLAEYGLQLEVVGPQGRVATVGAGASSLVGKLATGSRAIAPGDGRAVLALGIARGKRNPLAVAAGLSVLAALVAGAVVLAGRRSR